MAAWQGLPTDFQGWSELVVKYLSYVEEISPFKVGNIQKLISDVSKDAYVPLPVPMAVAPLPAAFPPPFHTQPVEAARAARTGSLFAVPAAGQLWGHAWASRASSDA